MNLSFSFSNITKQPNFLDFLRINEIKLQRNWVFATNLNFLTPISLQPDGVNLWYFKLRLFDLTELIVWNIKGLEKRVANWKIRVCGKTQIFCEKLVATIATMTFLAKNFLKNVSFFR